MGMEMSKCCSEREKFVAQSCCTGRTCDMLVEPKVDPVKEHKMNKHIESL